MPVMEPAGSPIMVSRSVSGGIISKAGFTLNISRSTTPLSTTRRAVTGLWELAPIARIVPLRLSCCAYSRRSDSKTLLKSSAESMKKSLPKSM